MIEVINASGLCQCGCGRATPISKTTDPARGLLKGQHTRFCMGHRKSMVDKPDEFWSRVDRRGPDDCWEWLGYINDSGYGVTRAKYNKCFRAHRIAYELTFGIMAEGLFACHKCDNRKCCNPNHLFPGTAGDNNADMHSKGRESRDHGKKGQDNNGAKLNADDIRSIRDRYKAGGILQRELAA